MGQLLVEFFVHGVPRPGGSKTGFIVRTRTGKQRAVVRDASGKVKDWRADVSYKAANTWLKAPLKIPLRLVLEFIVPRPKGHFSAKGTLRRSAPKYPSKRPDLTKLARAVEDALSAIIYEDDALVVDKIETKRFGASPGVKVMIHAME